MEQIKQSEDLYFGIVEKQLKNPFNESFPFMAGFVDHYISKIDDPPSLKFSAGEEPDFKLAQKVTSAFEKISNSPLPNAKWRYKDRAAKNFALFSGRGINKIFSERDPKFKVHFGAIDYYDFHCEPAGGGILEHHLYCGEENIFKTKEDVEEGVINQIYDPLQVKELIGRATEQVHKDNADEMQNNINRHSAFGLDPLSHNYVGQDMFKFVEWYMTYKGVRWYLLFDAWSRTWIRVKPLREVTASDLFPYKSWATNENARLFWSKAPCDDARPIARYINKALNQELYNREKVNRGQRMFDPTMVHDTESLSDWRPDGLTPIDTKGGTRKLADAVHTFDVAGLNGTIDLVQFLDAYAGQKTGSTPSSQGASEKDKKVGIFFGELQQIDEFIGVKNKSYKETWEEIGHQFVNMLDEDLDDEGMQIKLMGAKGVEFSQLTREELDSKDRELDIIVTGGSAEEQETEARNAKKANALLTLETVNPRWKDEETMRISGWEEEDIKRAFSLSPANQELMAEAAQAIEDILNNKTVKLNRSANAAFMEKIIETAAELDTIPLEKFNQLIEYAEQHVEIASANEARQAQEIIREQSGITPDGESKEKDVRKPALVV